MQFGGVSVGKIEKCSMEEAIDFLANLKAFSFVENFEFEVVLIQRVKRNDYVLAMKEIIVEILGRSLIVDGYGLLLVVE